MLSGFIEANGTGVLSKCLHVPLCSVCPSRRTQRKSNCTCRDQCATGKENAMFGEGACVLLNSNLGEMCPWEKFSDLYCVRRQGR